MARNTNKNLSRRNRHSNSQTQFSSGVRSGRKDMYSGTTGGTGGGEVRDPGPCANLSANESAMFQNQQYTLCPNGSCIQGAPFECPDTRMSTPGGMGSTTYRKGGRVRRNRPVRSNRRRKR